MSKVADMLSAVKTKITDLSDFAATDVVVGELRSLHRRQAADFPTAEIILDQTTGEEFFEQRGVQFVITFIINISIFESSPDRLTGVDMIAIADLAAKVRTALMGFIDDVTPPATGFLFTKPDYKVDYFYGIAGDNINNAILRINFLLDTPDTEA